MVVGTGGLLFAPKMRRMQYKTMLEPLEEKYGSLVTALIFLSSLFGDILWSAAVLAALGNTSNYIRNIKRRLIGYV